MEKFYAAYERKDLDGLMALWSAQGPNRFWQKMDLLLQVENCKFARPVLSGVKVDASAAPPTPSLTATVSLSVTDVFTKKSRQEQRVADFSFIKEAGDWKVWQYRTAADKLAAEIVAAPEEKRQALLADNLHLRTEELRVGLDWQARLLTGRGDYSEVTALCRLMHDIAGKTGDQGWDVSAWEREGYVHILQGDYKQALDCFQKALRICENFGFKWGIAQDWILIGIVHSQQGNYAQSLEHYQKAMDLAEEWGSKVFKQICLNNIGYIYALQGYFEKNKECYSRALEFCQKSLALSEELKTKALPDTLGIIGFIHARQGDYPQALEYYQKSLKLFDEGGFRLKIAKLHNSIGEVHSLQENYDEALKDYAEGLKIAEPIGARDEIFQAYRGLGNVHRAQKRKGDAIDAYLKAIDILEEMRSMAGGEEDQLTLLHAENRYDVYESLIALLLEQGGEDKIKEALTYLARAKSKQLFDGLRLDALKVRDPNLRELLAQTAQLEQTRAAQEKQRLMEISKPDAQQNKTRLANLTQSVASTQAELLQVTNRILAANPDYERFMKVTADDLGDIQEELPPKVVLVEYLPLETGLTIFVVTNQSAKVRGVPVARQRLNELVKAFHAEMRLAQRGGGRTVRNWDWQSDRAKRLRETLTALYGYLIAQIQKDIADAEAVVIVPSGMLYYLPFQALAHDVAPASSGQDAGSKPALRFFVEEKRIAVLTSQGLWHRIARQSRDGQGAAGRGRVGAFGNPDGTLPNAEQEVKRIGALFEGSLVYMGAAVTKDLVKRLPADVRMAHFATHAQVNEEDMNDSYLTLAGGEKLTLGDIYGMRGSYAAKVTVLSACETALGRKDPGKETVRLADGFVFAGSTTIIASLWKVADKSTAELMERFYKELKAGKSKAEAKRLAEISLLKNKETAHPYFWAPFVLIGDWR